MNQPLQALTDLLNSLDICPKCLKAWEIIDPTEPFATCGCPGVTSEWTGTPPVLSTLRQKAAKADRELTATDNLTISRSDADRIRELLTKLTTTGLVCKKCFSTVDEIRKLIPNPDA